MIRYIFLVVVVFFITFQSGFSQSARKVLKEGNVYFEQKQYRKALYKFSNYIDKKKSSGDVYLKIARCLYETSQLENAEDYLTNYLESTKHPDVNGFLLYADIYHSKLDFKHAIEYYKKYLAESKKNKSERAIVRDKIRRCAFGLRQGTSSSSVIVENMGAKVNSYNDDFRPILSPNYTDKLYFSSIRSGNLGGKRNVIGREDKMGDYSSDMFSTQVINGDWGNVKRLSSLTNTPRHDVILDFNSTGKALFFFKGFTLFAGDVLVDTFRVGKKPLYPNKFLSPFHPEKGDRGLCFYQDTIMFFASNRLEGFGGFDIYISFHKKQGWTKPLNVGSEINSVYDEVSPFLSADGKTLYFSSNNSRTSMGGFDIFKSVYNTIKWSTPKNLGLPINSAGDDLSYRLTKDGMSAFFDSDRKTGLGMKDIYVIYYSNFQKEQEKNIVTKSAISKLIDKKKAIVVTSTGEELTPDPDYSFSDEEKETYVLPVLFYESDSDVLNRNSQKQLIDLVKILRQYPQLIVTITGHSDETGSPKPFVLYFSIKRAEKIAKYLVENGINKNNIIVKGAGSAFPLATNQINGQENTMGKRMNKRIEFTISNASNLPINIVKEDIEISTYQKDNKGSSYENIIKGLYYTVQIATTHQMYKGQILNDYNDIFVERSMLSNKYIYNIGLYRSYLSAELLKRELISKGLQGIFVVPYVKGLRLSNNSLEYYSNLYPDLKNFINATK